VVLVRRNLLHQPLRAHCTSTRSAQGWRADERCAVAAEARNLQGGSQSSHASSGCIPLGQTRHFATTAAARFAGWTSVPSEAYKRASRCICSGVSAVWSGRLMHCSKRERRQNMLITCSAWCDTCSTLLLTHSADVADMCRLAGEAMQQLRG
jgi:hypothetical protein